MDALSSGGTLMCVFSAVIDHPTRAAVADISLWAPASVGAWPSFGTICNGVTLGDLRTFNAIVNSQTLLSITFVAFEASAVAGKRTCVSARSIAMTTAIEAIFTDVDRSARDSVAAVAVITLAGIQTRCLEQACCICVAIVLHGAIERFAGIDYCAFIFSISTETFFAAAYVISWAITMAIRISVAIISQLEGASVSQGAVYTVTLETSITLATALADFWNHSGIIGALTVAVREIRSLCFLANLLAIVYWLAFHARAFKVLVAGAITLCGSCMNTRGMSITTAVGGRGDIKADVDFPTGQSTATVTIVTRASKVSR